MSDGGGILIITVYYRVEPRWYNYKCIDKNGNWTYFSREAFSKEEADAWAEGAFADMVERGFTQATGYFFIEDDSE